MERRRATAVTFPGERARFAVTPQPGDADADAQVTWSVDGRPARTTGRRFATRFPAGGTYTVSAQCGSAREDFEVTVCPVDAWLAAARAFYGPSVDFSRIAVRTSWAVRGPAGMAWTCNDVIRFKRPRATDEVPHESTLIHELAHVWQHQSGRVQLLKGLIEQLSRLWGRDPYDYGGPDGLRATQHLTQLSNEGQAQVITEYWRAQRGHRADRKRVPFSIPGYVDELRRLVEGAGIGTQPPGRHGPAAAIDAAAARLVNGVVNLLG